MQPQPVAFADHGDAIAAQRAFEHQQDLAGGHRPCGDDGDLAGHARIERVADAEDVAEHAARRHRDVGIGEIDLELLVAEAVERLAFAGRQVGVGAEIGLALPLPRIGEAETGQEAAALGLARLEIGVGDARRADRAWRLSPRGTGRCWYRRKRKQPRTERPTCAKTPVWPRYSAKACQPSPNTPPSTSQRTALLF